VRTTPESPGDKAFARGQYTKATDAYRAELSAATDPDRVHDALLRAMLASGQIAEAESDANAWAAKSPSNAWAEDALAEVQWRKGDINSALTSIQKAVNLDSCNPRARADVAQFDRFSSRNLDAKLQINMAHHTDPIDSNILDEWLATLPRETQLDWATTELKKTDLSGEDRRSLEKWKDQLSKPPGAPCRLVSKLDSATIPYRRIQDGPNAPVFWGLDVGFNGRGRRMQIDTGASGLNLYKSAANALHLDIEKAPYKTGGIGNGGDVDTYIAKVSSIKIGALEFADCEVHILDVRPNQENPDSADDGLIGGDVFSSFVVTLDFPGHTMKLDPLPPVPGAEAETQSLQTGVEDRQSATQNRYIAPSMASWTKVFRSYSDLVIPVRLDKGPIKLFIVDTGSALNLISPQAASEVVKVMKGADVDLFGISGKVAKAYTTMPLTLVFGGMSQPTSGLTALDMNRISNGAGIELSGFLGQPTLHQMTVQIDYRDALMNFTYDPKRLVRCAAITNVNRSDECF
jgi:tetratricopeptide (TPR) repeat protein